MAIMFGEGLQKIADKLAEATQKAKLALWPEDALPLQTAETLLTEPARKRRVNKIPELLLDTVPHYAELYQNLICRYAEFVQVLPATAQNFFTSAGGLLDLGLETTLTSLTLLKDYLQKLPEPLEQQSLWTYAVFSASLLRSVGFTITELEVRVFQADGKTQLWNPLLGPISALGLRYRYESKVRGTPELRKKVTPLLAQSLMPTEGLAWISSDTSVLDFWIDMLSENEEHLGTLAEIVSLGHIRAIVRFIDTEFEATLKTPGSTATSLFDHKSAKDSLPNHAGKAFYTWLKRGLAQDKWNLGSTTSAVQETRAGLLTIKADAFKEFIADYAKYGSSEAVRKSFVSLGLLQSYFAANAISSSLTKTAMSDIQIRDPRVLSQYLPADLNKAFSTTESAATALYQSLPHSTEKTQTSNNTNTPNPHAGH